MSVNLFSQGLELLVYGMGTVVVFLTLLVFATRLMSLLILRFFPEAPAAAPRRSAGSLQSPQTPSPEMLAAIASAVHQHRQRSRAASASDSHQRKTHV